MRKSLLWVALSVGVVLGGASASALAAKGQKVAFPPIPEGYYAFGMSCQAAIAKTGEEPPEYLVRFTRKYFQEGMGGPIVESIVDQGGGVYLVRARSYGNGDDNVGQPDNFRITLVGTNGFRIENNMTEHYTHCPQVPKQIREDWFEFDGP